MKKIPLWARILMYYFVTLLLTGAFAFLQESTGVRPEYIQVAQVGPAVAALIFLLLEGESILGLLRNGLRPVMDRFALVAVLTPMALGVVVYALSKALFGIAKPIGSIGALDAFYVLSTVLAALCEQIGWRGYVLPRLQARLTPLKSSIILALLWSFWHIPNLFRGVAFFGTWFMGIVGLTVVLNHMFNRNGGNLWAVTLIHASVNVAAYFLLEVTDIRVLLLISISYILWAIGLMVFERRVTKAGAAAI